MGYIVHYFSPGDVLLSRCFYSFFFQVMNGFFVHYFSPEGLPPVRKSVVFDIDVSDSMKGLKMDYTKEALIVILDDLNEGDRFNIVTFESNIRVWRDAMLDVTPKTIEAAKRFVHNMDTYSCK